MPTRTALKGAQANTDIPHYHRVRDSSGAFPDGSDGLPLLTSGDPGPAIPGFSWVDVGAAGYFDDQDGRHAFRLPGKRWDGSAVVDMTPAEVTAEANDVAAFIVARERATAKSMLNGDGAFARMFRALASQAGIDLTALRNEIDAG